MSQRFHTSRRGFLKRSFAFSAAACLSGSQFGCSDPGVTYGDAVNVLGIADWGWNGSTAPQASVAQAMSNMVQTNKLSLDAMFFLGDNFYGALQDVNDPRWQTQLEQMYPAAMCSNPIYGVPGNHDYETAGNGELKYAVEMQYAQAMKTRWTMPSQSYSFTLGVGAPRVTVIALDSNVPTNGGSTMTDAQRLAQLAWLEAELAKPLTTPFRIVVAHHPLYSNGPHGDNAQLISDWGPLFAQYNVHAYIAGHDHDLQHLELAGLSTSFVVAGGGGASLYPVTSNSREPFGDESYGFLHLQATADLMTVRYLDPTGTVLHAFSKTPAGTTIMS